MSMCEEIVQELFAYALWQICKILPLRWDFSSDLTRPQRLTIRDQIK